MRQVLQKNKRLWDEDGAVQDLAVLKRIKRAAESDEKRARLKQQEIFIPQWPELAIIARFYNYNIIAIHPSRASLALKMF